MDDFPAAHSMDTTWFAVDADGHVGRFDSGETGAVPNRAAADGNAGNTSFDTFELDALLLARVLAKGPLEQKRGATSAYPQRVVVVLEPVNDDTADYRSPANRSSLEKSVLRDAVPLGESPRILMTREPLDPSDLVELATHPDVRDLLDENEVSDIARELADGTFDYELGDGGRGDYARSRVALRPIRVSELPASLRNSVQSMQLPVRFASAERIQLFDHVTNADVTAWDDDESLTRARGEPIKALLIALLFVAVIVALVLLMHR